MSTTPHQDAPPRSAHGGAALILGATSPIARATARLYAQQGRPVCVAARKQQEAQRLADDLKVRHQVPTLAIAFDATDFDAHPGLVKEVSKALGPIGVALLAFGEMGQQEDSQESFESAHKVIDINYTGAVSICEALAAHMVKEGQGAIVGISSVAGDRGRASNYFYGSAKGAFTLYLQGLRNRLFKDNVPVVTVKLGFIDTRMTFGMETGIPIASPRSAAAAIVKAASRGTNTLYYPPFWAGIMGVIKSIPEGIFKRLSL